MLDCYLLSSFLSSLRQNLSAAFCFISFPEAMGLFSFSFFRLVSLRHIKYIIYENLK